LRLSREYSAKSLGTLALREFQHFYEDYMTNLTKEEIQKKFEKTQNEIKQIQASANFFRQNLEQSQIRLIQLESQANLLQELLKEPEKKEEPKKEEVKEEPKEKK
jgi:hypothetical protein